MGNSSVKESNSSFRNLKDIKKATIGLTYKQLNELTKGKTVADFQYLGELFSPNTPLPLFEESMRLLLLDNLKARDAVEKILLNKNEYQITRILKCKWFFKQSPSTEFYFVEVLPNLSVRCRNRVLKKVSLYLNNEKIAENFFEFVRSNYGSEKAELFLPVCSKGFIMKYFKEAKPMFHYIESSRVLLRLSQRFPELVIDMLLFHIDPNNGNLYKVHQYKRALQFIASRHQNLFVPFFIVNYSKLPFLRFGRHLSRKLGLQLKSWLFESPSKSKYKYFCNKSLYLTLNLEEKVNFLVCLMSPQIDNWKEFTISRIIPYLKLSKPNERYSIINLTFTKVYGKDIWTLPNMWNSELLEVLPESLRQNYAKNLLIYLNEKGKSEEEMLVKPEAVISLLPWKFAFGQLKKVLVEVGTIDRRQQILNLMLKNCIINRDSEALKKLVQYVTEQRRNEEPHLIFDLLTDMCDSSLAKELKSTHFQKIEEIATLCVLKDPYSIDYAPLMEKCIYQRLEENLDVSEQTKKVVKFVFLGNKCFSELLHDYKSNHSRDLFFEYYHKLFSWIDKNSTETNVIKVLLLAILQTVVNFNKHNKNNQILLENLPELVLELNIMMKDNHGYLANTEMEDLYLTHSEQVTHTEFKPKLLKYTLKKNPKFLMLYTDEFLDDLFINYHRWKCLFEYLKKTLSFLQITDAALKVILNEFKSSNFHHRKLNALRLYSHISEVDDFTAAITEYLPAKATVDTENDTDFSEIQLLIPLLIANLKPHRKSLLLINKFCKGDFLKNARGPLYSFCYRLPPEIVIEILKENLTFFLLNEGMISLKKDTIRLIAELLPFTERVTFCNEMWDKILHYSIRTILLRYVSNSFIQSQSPNFFQTLEKFICESDELVIEARPKMHQIPEKYLEEYTYMLWEFPKFRNSVLSFFRRNNIHFLSSHFCENVIKENLFTAKLRVNEFTVNYLTCDGQGDNKSKLNMVMSLWNAKKDDVNITHVSDFLNTLFRIPLSVQRKHQEIFQTIIEKWPYVDSFILFDERMLLKALSDYTQNNYMPCNFSHSVLIPVYVENLKTFFSTVTFLDPSFSPYVTILNILKEGNLLISTEVKRNIRIVCLLALPDKTVLYYKEGATDLNVEDKKALNYIFEDLYGCQDDIISVYFKRKFGYGSPRPLV